jgi:hypothetical protein
VHMGRGAWRTLQMPKKRFQPMAFLLTSEFFFLE